MKKNEIYSCELCNMRAMCSTSEQTISQQEIKDLINILNLSLKKEEQTHQLAKKAKIGIEQHRKCYYVANQYLTGIICLPCDHVEAFGREFCIIRVLIKEQLDIMQNITIEDVLIEIIAKKIKFLRRLENE